MLLLEPPYHMLFSSSQYPIEANNKPLCFTSCNTSDPPSNFLFTSYPPAENDLLHVCALIGLKVLVTKIKISTCFLKFISISV